MLGSAVVDPGEGEMQPRLARCRKQPVTLCCEACLSPLLQASYLTLDNRVKVATCRQGIPQEAPFLDEC